MAKRSTIVYSTDPNFRPEEDSQEEQDTPAAKEQRLTVRLDRKHRGGKTVTLIEGFRGKNSDLEDFGKKIKAYCGTGGAVKDGQVIIQGDHREKVIAWLKKNDYTGVKSQS